jgi:hypothetical protein
LKCGWYRWKYFGRNMLWLAVIGGGLILLHLLLLLYLRLRFRGGTGSYGALVLPRFEIMLAFLAMPCISQASAALIRGTPQKVCCISMLDRSM